jgi:ferredoxin
LASKKIVLRFSAALVEQPIIYNLIKNYDLMFNIIKAEINPRREGSLIMELSGKPENFQEGIKFLEDLGVVVEPLSEMVVRDEERCTHCGACIVVCPVSALYLERPSMEVVFDNEKCVVCGVCVQYCLQKAMDVKWGD